MAVYEFGPINVTVAPQGFTYSSDVADLELTHKGSIGRVQTKIKTAFTLKSAGAIGRVSSKASLENYLRLSAAGSIGRIQTKAVLSQYIGITKGGTIGHVQSSADLTIRKYASQFYYYGANNVEVATSIYSFSTPIVNVITKGGTVGRIQTKIKAGYPVIVNGGGSIGRVRTKAVVGVPFAIRALSAIGRIATKASLFIPPFNLAGGGSIGRIQTKNFVEVPIVGSGELVAGKASLFGELSMGNFVNGDLIAKKPSVAGILNSRLVAHADLITPAPYVTGNLSFSLEIDGTMMAQRPSIEGFLSTEVKVINGDLITGLPRIAGTMSLQEGPVITGEMRARAPIGRGRLINANTPPPSDGEAFVQAYGGRRRGRAFSPLKARFG